MSVRLLVTALHQAPKSSGDQVFFVDPSKYFYLELPNRVLMNLHPRPLDIKISRGPLTKSKPWVTRRVEVVTDSGVFPFYK